MSANEPDLQPDDLEVLQAENNGPEPAVLVHVEGPIRNQQMPNKQGATRTRSSVGTTPIRLLTADHRRASFKLMSIGGNMLFAFNSAAAADPSAMATWPQNVQYAGTHDGEVWAAAATGTTSISVVTEYWATGE